MSPDCVFAFRGTERRRGGEGDLILHRRRRHHDRHAFGRPAGVERPSRSPGRSWRIWIPGAAWLVAAATLAGAPAGVAARWRRFASSVRPFKTVETFAASRRIPLAGFELAPDARPRPGDAVTLLVTLRENRNRTQWLVLVRTAALTPAEAGMPPLPEDSIYTSTGRILKFRGMRAALAVSYVGPFTEGTRPPADMASRALAAPLRVLVNGDSLSVGLDRYAETALRLSERARLAHMTDADFFYIGGGSPLPPRLLEKGRRFKTLIRPTAGEERIVFSVSFALNEFLRAALKVPAFRRTVDEVMDKPSLWSVLTAFGAHQFLDYDPRNVRKIAAAAYPFPLPTYELPVKLSYNAKLAVRAALVMSGARPPLEACGGLVLVYAEHPRDPDRQLLIRVLACRPGQGPHR